MDRSIRILIFFRPIDIRMEAFRAAPGKIRLVLSRFPILKTVNKVLLSIAFASLNLTHLQTDNLGGMVDYRNKFACSDYLIYLCLQEVVTWRSVAHIRKCDNGHIACASCCIKLKNKCHSCSLPIGYSRCLAIEKIVESIKVSCRYARYGCKEKVNYTDKFTHEKECGYAPCSCPVPDCNFLGSTEQLSLHFGSNHWASSIRFQYNCSIPLSLDKNRPFIILHGEDGRLFILNNSNESLGNAISVASVGANPIECFSYDLMTRGGGRSLRLQSFTVSVKRQTDASATSLDFLLVPHYFSRSVEQLKLEVCIWKAIKMA
ncbi:hypothetical protein ACLOJK_001360 [Asimina triloba]